MSKLDMRSAEFWDLSKVEGGFRWSADIGTGCRGCLPLCPSFKVLFDRLDVEAVDGDAEKLPERDLKEVVDLCYQCKLCFNHCPYTPPHRWEVDFPRLMLRARAAEARRSGVTRQDRILGNTALVGRLGSLTAPLSNWMGPWSVHRALRHHVRPPARAVRRGRGSVLPGPTCSYMLKQEFPWLDGSEEAKLVASHTRALFEFLAQLAAAGRLDTGFQRPAGPIAYHVPRHLRAQNIGPKSAGVLPRIPGTEVPRIGRVPAAAG